MSEVPFKFQQITVKTLICHYLHRNFLKRWWPSSLYYFRLYGKLRTSIMMLKFHVNIKLGITWRYHRQVEICYWTSWYRYSRGTYRETYRILQRITTCKEDKKERNPNNSYILTAAKENVNIILQTRHRRYRIPYKVMLWFHVLYFLIIIIIIDTPKHWV